MQISREVSCICRYRSIPSQELWYLQLVFVIMLSCKKGDKISERWWLRALKLHVNSLEVKSRSIAKLQGLPTILAIPWLKIKMVYLILYHLYVTCFNVFC